MDSDRTSRWNGVTNQRIKIIADGWPELVNNRPTGTYADIRPTAYRVTCLPDDPETGDALAVWVEYRPTWDGKPAPLDRRWTVRHGSRCMNRRATWDWASPDVDDDRAAWWADHRFSLETALELAVTAAPDISVNGWTAAMIIADQRKDAGR